MNKQNVLWVLLDLVFLVVFNIVFFVVGGTEHEPSAWLSYGFIHFAYLMVVVTPFLTRKSSSSSVFGFTLFAIAVSYFLVELVVGVVFCILNMADYKVALVTQVVLAGIYLAILLSNLIANEETADALQVKEGEVAFIKTGTIRLKGLLSSTGDKQTDKAIETAYDTLRSSPTSSDPSVRQYELAILDDIDGLEAAINNNDLQNARGLAERITSNANERKLHLRLTQ